MEKNSNPAALTPQGVDQEAFDRVWRRVMPDQAQSPIAIGRAEVDEIAPAGGGPPGRGGAAPGPAETPGPPAETAPHDQGEAAPVPAETPVQPAASPTPPPPSRSKAEEAPPFCLGSQSQGEEQTLTSLMDLAKEGVFIAQALVRRGGSCSRSLSCLAADHRRALRQLSAAYFLIIGQRYRPPTPSVVINASLPLALRDQFVWEQRWERANQQAAETTSDACLKELYQELAQDGVLHAATIRSLLEQMG